MTLQQQLETNVILSKWLMTWEIPEWLSKAQIRSFFSRIGATRRKQAFLQSERQIHVDSDDDFGPWLQEIELLDQAVEEN